MGRSRQKAHQGKWIVVFFTVLVDRTSKVLHATILPSRSPWGVAPHRFLLHILIGRIPNHEKDSWCFRYGFAYS